MRAVLEVLRDFRHPVTIVTKGTLIERDIDILGEMAAEGLARSASRSRRSTRDCPAGRWSRACRSPARRLATIRRLTEAGMPVRVMVSPMIPALTDHELEAILAAARRPGRVAASWIMLRLPLRGRGSSATGWPSDYPDRAARVMGRVRELHGGRDYDPDWGKRMTGEGALADLMRHRFAVAVQAARPARGPAPAPDGPLRATAPRWATSSSCSETQLHLGPNTHVPR
jgi:DNA repair photolyase